ncbi:hypothetical protein B0H17DRAFT_1127983 [Mycena rosella]|uniref:Gag protein n=1 Tax=Mycena rosella TaxID=1033263 RepID=A0AAD7GN77_MYCRO|nr:hypothetical protein B0H17DRAFT_1127983 [Mycena rosella]
MAEFVQFTGERDAREPAAADFIKRMNAHFRATQVTSAVDKFIEVGDHFKHGSPADKWYEFVKMDATMATERGDWDTFSAAFRTRFKGATPVAKPRGQLEAELSRMRIAIGDLARGTVHVGDKDVYVLVDFVKRVCDAIADLGVSGSNTGLWDFYNGLPPVLQEAVGGVVPASWAAMLAALDGVPQSKVEVATAQHRVQQALVDQFADLQKKMAAMTVSASRVVVNPPRAPNVPAPVSPTSAPNPPNQQQQQQPAAAGRGKRPPPTIAQKELLHGVLRKCVRRQHLDTPAGHAAYARDITAWHEKFCLVAPSDLQLETTGYPLTPGTPCPCAGKCWRCGAVGVQHSKDANGCAPCTLLPRNEIMLRALGGTWLGRTSLTVPITAPVNVVEVVEQYPWYETRKGEGAQAEEVQEGFVEGLQQ